ncbi:calcium-binding protein [Candidatus Bealeia paramacronuclearis]
MVHNGASASGSNDKRDYRFRRNMGCGFSASATNLPTGFTASLDATQPAGHQVLDVFYNTVLIGKLDVKLSSGDYVWTNTADAEGLPEGANKLGFTFNLNDGSGSDDCTASIQLNVAINGDAPCVMTLKSENLGVSTDDDIHQGTDGVTVIPNISGNFITDSGAVDSDPTDQIVVQSVALSSILPSDLSQSSADSTNTTTGDAIHTITIFDASGVVGTLTVDMTTGAYNWANGPEAEKLPEGANEFDFKFVIGDNQHDDPCSANGTLKVTVTGDDQCQITFGNFLEGQINSNLNGDTFTAQVNDDELGSGGSGNLVNFFGASDSDGDTIHVGDIKFNGATGFTSSVGTSTNPSGDSIKTILVYDSATQDASHLVGTLTVDLTTGAASWANGAGAEDLAVGAHVFGFDIFFNDGSGSDDCTKHGTLDIKITGDEACVMTLTADTLNVSTDDDVATAINGHNIDGNLIVDSGAVDSDPTDQIVVQSVGLTSAVPSGWSVTPSDSTDTTTGDAIHTITISDGSGVVGTLTVDMKTGAYNWVNGPEAEKLPEGANPFHFAFVIADNQHDDPCSANGTLKITVTGDDQCQITLGNFPPATASSVYSDGVVSDKAIEDEVTSGVSANFIAQSGAQDSDGDAVHVASVTLVAPTATNGLTTGFTATMDPIQPAGHQVLDVLYNSVLIGKLDVTLSSGDYVWTNTADAEGLPEGANKLGFTFNLNDGSGSDDCTASGQLNITITGDNDCPVLDPNNTTLTNFGPEHLADGTNSAISKNNLFSNITTPSEHPNLTILSVNGITDGGPGDTNSSMDGHIKFDVFLNDPLSGHPIDAGTVDFNTTVGTYTFNVNSSAIAFLNGGDNPSWTFNYDVTNGFIENGAPCTVFDTLILSVNGITDNNSTFPLYHSAMNFLPTGFPLQGGLATVHTVEQAGSYFAGYSLNNYSTPFGMGGFIHDHYFSGGYQTSGNGTSENDIIYAHDATTVHGNGGNDFLVALPGGTSGVILYGDSGNDVLIGGAGGDNLYAGTGGCFLSGGAGNDTLHGGSGNDMMLGGLGNDVLFAGAGVDTLDGGAGNDYIVGSQSATGHDLFYGGVGNDLMVGSSSGNDVFVWDVRTPFSSTLGSLPSTTVMPGTSFSETSDVINNFNASNDLLRFEDVFDNSGVNAGGSVLDDSVNYSFGSANGYQIEEGTLDTSNGNFAVSSTGADLKLDFGVPATHGSVIIQNLAHTLNWDSTPSTTLSFANLDAALVAQGGHHLDVIL